MADLEKHDGPEPLDPLDDMRYLTARCSSGSSSASSEGEETPDEADMGGEPADRLFFF